MENLIIIIIAILISIVLFFILREVFCWYWKINEGIKILDQQNLTLQEILKILKSQTPEENFSDSKIDNTFIKNDYVKKETITDEELMIKHNITFANNKYIYNEYKYDKLTDAVDFAKSQDSNLNK